FGAAGGAARHTLAVLSSATGLATAWNPGPAGCLQATPDDPICVDAVHSLSLSADAATVYAAGAFTSAGGLPRTNLAALSASTGAAAAWNPAANAPVRTVVPSGTRVFAGGDLTSVNALTRNRVAVLDAGTGSLVTGFNADADDFVEALALSEGGTRLFL